MSMSRREFTKTGAAVLGSATSLMWALPTFGNARNAARLLEEGEEIYADSIVIDMLSGEYLNDDGLQKIAESQLTCFSPTLGTRRPRNPRGTYMLQAFPLEAAVEDCVAWSEFIAGNNMVLTPALRTEDIYRAKKLGKVAILLNFQNTPIEDKLENLDVFHRLGVRSMQVTYNERNLLGSGCTERTDGGLSDFGIAAVHRMNELGILVDSSHSGYQTTLDTIEFSKATPIFSHANCAALNPHPRNKSDEQIRALAEKGGVLGLTTVNILVRRDPPATLEDFLDHVDHVVKLVGIDHVALGSDQIIRGWETDPSKERDFLASYGPELYKASYRFRYPLATEGLNEPIKWKYATAGLIQRGYREEDIKKILGGNWLRVFSEVIG